MRTKYLRYLPLLILAVIPTILWDNYLQKTLITSGPITEFSLLQGLFFRLSRAFSEWLAFILVGFVFNKKKEALIAIAVHLFFILLFVLAKIKLPIFLLYLPITLVPYLVFGFLAFGSKRLWVWALMLIPIYLGSALTWGDKLFSGDFNFFISLFSSELGGEEYLEPLGDEFKLSIFLDPMIYYIFLAEIALLFNQKHNFNFRIVDLTMSYSRLGATFLFIFLRLSIYLCILSASGTIDEIFNPTTGSSGPWGTFNLNVLNLMKLLAALSALVAVLWYYRRFLMEFLFERGKRPSWGYWLLQVPFLEVIIFAFMVLSLKKRDTEDRHQVFLYHSEEGSNDVKIIRGIMVVIQILAIVYILANPSKKELTTFIILDKLAYSLLVIFYLINRKVIVWLFAWILLNIIFVSFGLINDLEFDARLMSFSILFVLIGLLQGGDFTCISPYNEGEETGEEEDLWRV